MLLEHVIKLLFIFYPFQRAFQVTLVHQDKMALKDPRLVG